MTVITGHVTVFRAKFSHNSGEGFGLNLSGQKFVFHCHILEHEDNDMMSAMKVV